MRSSWFAPQPIVRMAMFSGVMSSTRRGFLIRPTPTTASTMLLSNRGVGRFMRQPPSINVRPRYFVGVITSGYEPEHAQHFATSSDRSHTVFQLPPSAAKSSSSFVNTKSSPLTMSTAVMATGITKSANVLMPAPSSTSRA